MDNQLFTSIVSILTAVVGVAILATIVSKNSNTAGVLTAGGSAFSNILGTALSPVTGNQGLFSANNNTLQLNTGNLL
jgi:hypothetical protein